MTKFFFMLSDSPGPPRIPLSFQGILALYSFPKVLDKGVSPLDACFISSNLTAEFPHLLRNSLEKGEHVPVKLTYCKLLIIST